MMSIQVQMVAAAPRSSAGPGRGPACACAVRAVGLVLPALIASLLVFRPQDDGPGLPPAAGEHGPLVPEQGGHVRTGRARLGEELEEGMRQIQKVSVSPLVPGQSQTPSRTARAPPSRHRGPERWPVPPLRVALQSLRSSQPRFAHVQDEVVGVAEAPCVGREGRRVSVERASVRLSRPSRSACRGRATPAGLGSSVSVQAPGTWRVLAGVRVSLPRTAPTTREVFGQRHPGQG